MKKSAYRKMKLAELLKEIKGRKARKIKINNNRVTLTAKINLKKII